MLSVDVVEGKLNTLHNTIASIQSIATWIFGNRRHVDNVILPLWIQHVAK